MVDNLTLLNTMACYFGTDKKDHGYLPFYAAHLPGPMSSIKILEIGVKQGASARMWLDYFPNSEFHGLDLFMEYDIPFDHPRAKWYKGNQCDWRLLEQLRNENFDVIIDDGSHNSRDQLITFFGLFHEGCSYFVEDLHCGREEFYRQGLHENFTIATILEEQFLQTHKGADEKIMLIKKRIGHVNPI